MGRLRLEGKVAIITGGGGGIGSAAGRIFCEEGAKVALVDREPDVVRAAEDEIRRRVNGAQVAGFVADLGEERAAEVVVDETIAAFGGLDVLVNNVGIRRYEQVADAPWETLGRHRTRQSPELCVHGEGRASSPATERAGQHHQRVLDRGCLRPQKHGRL